MRSRVRENLPALAAATLGILIVGWLTLSDWAWTDYDHETRPAFDALLSGHVVRFLQLAPAYGGSLVMRAPFVLASKLWGGGELSTFRVAAAPCLAASAVLAVWLVARLRSLGHPRTTRAIVLALCVANPLTLPTLESGHAEELLGAVLCVAAVLAAIDRRAVWAGILLGLAIANKEWALLAVGPVLIALPQSRRIALLCTGGVAAAILAPLALAGGLLAQAQGAATQAAVIFNPWQVWWFLGGHAHILRDASGHIVLGHQWAHRVEPALVGVISHPLIIASAVPLTLLCVIRRRHGLSRPANEALLLLALLLLLRCVLDPWDISYYSLPFLLALVVWEALTFERPPALALGAAFAAWFVFEWAGPNHGFSPDAQSLLFLALVVPTLIAICLGLYMPGMTQRLRLRFTRRQPALSPA